MLWPQNKISSQWHRVSWPTQLWARQIIRKMKKSYVTDWNQFFNRAIMRTLGISCELGASLINRFRLSRKCTGEFRIQARIIQASLVRLRIYFFMSWATFAWQTKVNHCSELRTMHHSLSPECSVSLLARCNKTKVLQHLYLEYQS